MGVARLVIRKRGREMECWYGFDFNCENCFDWEYQTK